MTEPSPSGRPSRGGRWLPAVLYAAVTVLLFRGFVFTDQMLLGQDTLSLGFVAREFFARSLRAGAFPLWNPYILGGTPFLDSLAGGDSLYPTSLLLLLTEPYRALGWKLVLHVFLAGLFMYGWIRTLGRSRYAALLCGLAYLLAPFMVTLVYPGHDGKLFVTALTPLLFWVTERALLSGRSRAYALVSLSVALVILTTHFQQAYFLFGALAVYALVRVILLGRQRWQARQAAFRYLLFAAFSVLGAGVSAVQLLPAVRYVTEFSRRTATTTRATEEGSVSYSSSWSLHPEEIASLVVPEFVGSSVRGSDWTEDTYWGRNPFKLNHEYAGLVVLLLASLALFGGVGKGIRMTFLGMGVIALLYALGGHTPVWRLFYEVVPGISLFRAPSIAAFLFGFSSVTLMSFGVDRVLGVDEEGKGKTGEGNDSNDDASGPWRRRALILLGGATAGLLLFAVLASSGALTSLWTSVVYPSIDAGKAQALERAGPFITRGFMAATLLAGGVLLLTWLATARRIPSSLAAGGVAVLVIVDLWRVDAPFIQTMDFRSWARPDPNAQYLQERAAEDEPFRVLSMGGQFGLGQDVKPALYGLELAGGHHPNDLARYRELIGMVGSGIPSHLIDPATGAPNLPLLSILNVRYVIWPVYQFGGFSAGEPVMATTLSGNRPYEAVYELPTLPRARLVGRAVVLPDSATVGYLRSPAFQPAEEVVLPEAPPVALPGGTVAGEVVWLERGINASRLRVKADSPALLVISENWYPAWKARVNGVPAPVLRANHTLRAIPVGEGEQEVEVFFDWHTLNGAMLISAASLLVLLLLGLRGRRGGISARGRENA